MSLSASAVGTRRGDGRAWPALPGLWVNGERVDPAAPHLSAADRGFTLADGVFETMRLYGGRAFRLDAHLARLRRGADALGIPAPPSLDGWVGAALAAAADAGVQSAGVRVTLSRGVGAGLLPPASPAPTLVVAVTALPAFPAGVYDEGLALHVASGRRNEHAITAGLKTLAYTDAVAATIEAHRAGADDALLLDTAGHCSEAAASNLFALVDGALVTPPVSCGALPGITRAAVLELAAALGLPTAERPLALPELLAAGEAFLTSSLRELAPVSRVGPHSLGNGRPGPRTRALAAAFAALTGGGGAA